MRFLRDFFGSFFQDFTLSSKEKRFVQEHRIQVTTNKSVFRILTIPDNYNAIMIKQSILIKVEMKGDPERYHFYHENGSRQDLTLGDEELVDICKRSDNSLTNRIFVKPVDYVQHGWASKTLAEPATDIHSHSRLANNNPMSMKNRYPNMYPPPGQQPIYYEGYDPVWYGHNAERLGHCVLPVAATNPLHEPHIIHSLSQGLNTPLPRNDPHIANGNTTSHLQMSQQKGYSFEPRTNGLPRTYARKNSQPLTNTSLVENSTHPSNPPSTPSSSHPGSMWAVRPSNSSPVPNSMWAVQPTKTPTSSDSTPSSLWPVESQYIESRKNRDSPPIKSITSSTVSEGSTTDTVYGGSSFKKLADVEGITLYDPPQSGSKEHYLHDPSEPSTPTPFDPSASSFPSSSTLTNIIKTTKTDEINDALWEVRPSVDTLFEDIDAYLPGHDLDKAMIVDPLQQPMPLPTASSKPLCTLGPSKSIRVVAKEAHNNWRKSTKVTRNSNMLRRRSTKMWGTNVQQIKPGTTTMSQVIGKNKISGEKTDDTPTTRWMRGRLIGIGTYGRVYHAFNLDAKEWIAVKVVELPTTPSDMINKDLCEAAETIYREAELLTGLKHDNIVQYLGSDVDMEKGHIHIFLEYVAGGSISTCLTRNGCFDEPLVRYFTRQILSGLKYLHDLNILHRDIKAGNILVDEYGVCKIADFGLSKEGDEYEAYNVNADHSSMRGTVFWMAPEVVRGRKYNAKIDIWSLGCTVIEMLTGKHPWVDFHSVATIFQLGNEQAPPLPSNISDEARSFLNKCLTIEAEDRPTAAELLKDPFVQEYPDFELKKHIIKLGIERKISQRMAK
ncbi:kinase-like domain-containing protein [Spinellus fusiger]|nr:kinase-like domain-containing protein [Spinellus fusiger]